MFENQPGESQLRAEPPSQRPTLVRRTATVTQVLIGINVLVFVMMCLSGVSPIQPSPEDLFRWGADFGPVTLHGQAWRIFTSMFLHFGIIHIGMNMYVLYQVGPFTELLYGRAKYLALYLVAGLGGSLVSLYIHPLSVGAGASGAIFGVYGALLAFLLIQRDVFPREVSSQIGRSAALFLGYNLIFGLSSGTTDLSAHIGGLATGFALGCLLAQGHSSGTRRMSTLR